MGDKMSENIVIKQNVRFRLDNDRDAGTLAGILVKNGYDVRLSNIDSKYTSRPYEVSVKGVTISND